MFVSRSKVKELSCYRRNITLYFPHSFNMLLLAANYQHYVISTVRCSSMPSSHLLWFDKPKIICARSHTEQLVLQASSCDSQHWMLDRSRGLEDLQYLDPSPLKILLHGPRHAKIWNFSQGGVTAIHILY